MFKRMFSAGSRDAASSTALAALEAQSQAQLGMIEALQAETEGMQRRFELIRQACSEGLWDMEVPAANATGVDNPFFWSAQFRRLLGFHDERDFPNVLASWSNLLHFEDKQKTLDAFAAHMGDRSGRTPYDVTYRLRCKDGVYRWFRARGQTLRAQDGTPLRVAGTLIPIDEDIKLQQNLETTNTRFELSREIVNDGVWDLAVVAGDPINPKNAFWWSDQFRRLLGFSDEAEFPNVLDSWASRLHPEDKDATLTAFANHLNDKTGQTGYDVSYRLRCKNEQYRWFRARGATKRAPDGTALQAVGALADIQAEKDREAAEKTSANYNAQLESSLKDIGEIVGTIQRIAQQTNLIALNAAVEAARAGEAGRGFSVIAGEIRSLSKRTSEATGDVTRIQKSLQEGQGQLARV
ncbi:MAG: PAS domain-containing protein [Rubrivivax sp.]|nr:MAG: PAS domain-containing protein [Rubrivivax sp.]